MSDFAGISAPPTGLLDGASLFLDLDGTLLELADTPEAVRAGPEVMSLLALATTRLSGRVAIVSGRSATSIAALLPGPPLNVGGSHGLELIWSDGRRNAPERPAALDHSLAVMRDLERRHDGLLVEDKPFGVALHYRRAPHLAEECIALAKSLARETGLPLQPGKMVQELKAGRANKGDAVAAFLAEPPMQDSVPYFIGDDLNDEAGFAAATEAGGAGILVGAGRETAARWRLPSVADTLGWLRAELEALP
jgi:trehalose 6-phosphate phosphatase